MITIEPLDDNNIPKLQELLMRCSDYLVFQDGEPVKVDAAKNLLISKPNNVSINNKKVLGIYMSRDHSLVGVIDIVMCYAGPDILTLGLLVIEPAMRRNGIGEKAEKLLENWARSNNFSQIRLGVLFGNDKGLRFWHKLGYKETGEIKPFLFHKFRVLVKAI